MNHDRKIASRDGNKVTLTIEHTYRNADPETVRINRHDMVAIVTDGIVRWDSNDRVPPRDSLAEMLELRGITQAEHDASVATERAETAEFLAAYRKADAERVVSDEERFEMRAAFGPGVEVVNIISGRVTRT